MQVSFACIFDVEIDNSFCMYFKDISSVYRSNDGYLWIIKKKKYKNVVENYFTIKYCRKYWIFLHIVLENTSSGNLQIYFIIVDQQLKFSIFFKQRSDNFSEFYCFEHLISFVIPCFYTLSFINNGVSLQFTRVCKVEPTRNVDR